MHRPCPALCCRLCWMQLKTVNQSREYIHTNTLLNIHNLKHDKLNQKHENCWGGTIVHILSAPFLRSSDVRWWTFEVSLLDRREDVVLQLVEQMEYINGKKKYCFAWWQGYFLEFAKMLMKAYWPTKTRWKHPRVSFIDRGTLSSSKQKLI